MADLDAVLQNRYHIVGLLGQGGMGAVYRVWDTRLKMYVALKEMVPQPGLDASLLDQLRQQFEKEATVLARLNHPHLVRVIDFFEENCNAYLVMDFVEGESLADRISRQGMQSEAEVIAWADQILDALECCHAQGILHRDIKPQNVVIRFDGRAVLVDFGLVKLWDPNNPSTYSVMRGAGTPQYSPLEQYDSQGSHTDARSDVYGLGATLYHALAGIAPPTATQRVINPTALAPLRSINSGVSKEVDAIIARAIELQPNARFQSATAMRVALQGGALPQSGGRTGTRKMPGDISPPRAGLRSIPAWGWGLGGIALIAVLMVALLLNNGRAKVGSALPNDETPIAATTAEQQAALLPSATSTPTITPIIEPPTVTTPTVTHTATPTLEPVVEVRPPARHLAFVEGEDWRRNLRLWAPATNEIFHIRDSISRFFWSPTGQHIGFSDSEGFLYVTDITGNVLPIGQTMNGEFAWSPNGEQMAYLDRDCKVRVVNHDGSQERIVADLSWSHPGGMGGGVMARDWINLYILTDDFFTDGMETFVLWASDSTRIAVRSSWLCKSGIIDQGGTVTPCVGAGGAGAGVDCLIPLDATTSKTSVSATANPDIFLQDLDQALFHYSYTGIVLNLTDSSPTNPDAITNLAYRTSLINWGFHNDFWLRNGDGTLVPLTETPTFKWQAAWSPDREWIAYTELIVTRGYVDSNNDFDGDYTRKIWILHPRSGERIQISNSGNARLSAWQPVDYSNR